MLWFILATLEASQVNPVLPPSWRVSFGRKWFQWRGISPLPWILAFVLFPAEFHPSRIQLGVLCVGILLAEGVRIWAVGFAGSVTRTRGDGVPRLIHAGPFRYVRNPLYIANIAIYALSGVAFGFSVLSLLAAVYFAIQYSFIVAFEEATLRREFGDAYGFYCARVSRWIPSFAPAVESSGHPFELAKAIRSERASLIALVSVVVLVAAKRSFGL